MDGTTRILLRIALPILVEMLEDLVWEMGS
jgi:hypothetical protein